MGKTLILIHGRNWKPPESELKSLWYDALKTGIRRDCPDELASWPNIRKEFVYYGDISNRFLSKKLGKPIPKDIKSRRNTLKALSCFKASEFTKENYNSLPGKESFREGIADVLGDILPFFNLSEALIGKVAPDMDEYWSDETEFGTLVRLPMIKPMLNAIKRGDSICIIAHSLGTMIAYDTLWKMSHYGEYYDFWSEKVDFFISLGSPLGDTTVKKHLKGSRNKGKWKYPTNLKHWLNIAAEDDFISHDGKIKNDFKEMKKINIIKDIKDEKIYNLSVRDGKSNPHHGVGYLVHPKVIRAVREWMTV